MEEDLIDAAERLVRKAINWVEQSGAPASTEKAREMAAAAESISVARCAQAQELLARSRTQEVRKRAGLDLMEDPGEATTEQLFGALDLAAGDQLDKIAKMLGECRHLETDVELRRRLLVLVRERLGA